MDWKKINNDGTSKSTIVNYTLLRLLEMLDLRFIMSMEEAVADKFETYTFNYLEYLANPNKILGVYTENMSEVVEKDLKKLEVFINDLENEK